MDSHARDFAVHLNFDSGRVDIGGHLVHVLCHQRLTTVGKSSRVSTFWAKFSPRAAWTALPKAMSPVGGSGFFRAYLNHQRVWQSMKQWTWLGESMSPELSRRYAGPECKKPGISSWKIESSTDRNGWCILRSPLGLHSFPFYAAAYKAEKYGTQLAMSYASIPTPSSPWR